MSDLPTLYREVCGCPDHGCDGPMPKGSIPTQTGWLEPVTEPLLTREEAANDPEVRRMVAAKSVGTLTVSDDQWRDYWHSNNDLPSGRYAIVPLEVTDDE